MAFANQQYSDAPLSAEQPAKSAPRYALFYAPEPGTPLAEFGRSWFGYDAETGTNIAHRQDYGLGLNETDMMTRTARHYGLHGTFRPPFRLRSGITETELIERTERFSQSLKTIEVGLPTIQRIGAFLALAPASPTPLLAHLHARCLFAIEHFRAPLSESERAKRLTSRLSPNQRLLMAQWGYPYVLDEFQFHITLTGPLSEHEQARVAPALSPALKDICLVPLEIGSICLFVEPGDGRPFRLLRRFPLKGGKASL